MVSLTLLSEPLEAGSPVLRVKQDTEFGENVSRDTSQAPTVLSPVLAFRSNSTVPASRGLRRRKAAFQMNQRPEALP